MEFVEALAAEGLVTVVGAGGLLSTTVALADRIDRAVVTATVRIPALDSHVASVVVTDDPVSALAAADTDRFPLGLVPERDGDRYLGYDPGTVTEIAHEGTADAVLVKADGARDRALKAPDENGPPVPDAADTVLPVVDASIEGKSLTAAHAHHPERVGELAGLSMENTILAEDVAQVLTSPDGGLKNVPGNATVVPVITGVEDAATEAAANRIGNQALQHDRIDRVALTRGSASGDELVAVLE